ncbi:unnamed protein product, partial [Tuber aestivum]
MDLFTQTSNNPYITSISKSFTIPSGSGESSGVALKTNVANLIISLYVLMVVFIFQVVWDLGVSVIVAFWTGDENSSRYLPLVVIWNSSGPDNAARLMWDYYRSIKTKRKKSMNQDPERQNPTAQLKRYLPSNPEESSGEQSSNEDWVESPKKSRKTGGNNLWWLTLFVCLTYAMWIGHLAAGLFIARKLWKGSYALANPDYIFYPDLDSLGKDGGIGGRLEKVFSLKAPSGLLALEYIDDPGPEVEERVITKVLEPPEGQTPNLWAGLSYTYNITGVDMGLQSDPRLTLVVNGSCHTDYTWLMNSTGGEDTYRVWGGKDTFQIKRSGDLSLPPRVTFFINDKQLLERSSNMSYAMIINTAGYYSRTQSQDPWYSTEQSRTNGTHPYQVLSKRPVLSCWEAKRWHLNGKDVEHTQLKKLPGLNLHQFWIEKVFPYEFLVPRVASLGSVTGTHTFKSTSLGATLYNSVDPSYILDAGSHSVLSDIEHWVKASWISDQGVLRDTTTYHSGGGVNSAEGPDGTVDPSIAGFVIENWDVDTLS